MFRQTKFYVGITLIVNAFVSLIAFFILLGKKKGTAGIFGALSAICGVIGALTIYDYKKTADEDFACCDCTRDDCDDCENNNEDDDVDIDSKDLFSRNEDN